jgi:DNA-binding NtrC family response regulator
LVARAVHGASARKAGPLVVVDCGSIPASLAEGVLFGHEKGAFTGATSRRKGALAEADGGTLFLDELGELPMELQPKLLRVLAERQVQRVGSNTPEPIDVRVVAATRRDLGREMNQGGFRSDLFFRIAQVRVELPPLRERASDLPLLVEAMCQKLGRPEATAVVRDWLAQHRSHHDWPGNVRELMNLVSVAATLSDDPAAIDDVLSVERLSREPPEPNTTLSTTSYGQARQEALRAFERTYFKELQASSGGNVSEMARRAGMERHHVRAFLRKLGLRE